MAVEVEAVPGFYLSAFHQFSTYDRRMLANRIAEFIAWKRAGNSGGGGPFSADKPSGRRSGQLVFPRYRAANIWHCHLDLNGSEPLLAYRVFEDQRRILMLSVTTDGEMFGRPHRFYRRFGRQTRGEPV